MNLTMALPRVQPLRSPAVVLDTAVIPDERGYYRGALRRFADGVTEWLCEHPHLEYRDAASCAQAKWQEGRSGAGVGWEGHRG